MNKITIWIISSNYPDKTATAIALQDTRCMIIERSRFDYLSKFNPHFMVSLIKSLTEKLRTTITKLNKIEPSSKTTAPDKTTLLGFFHKKRSIEK